MKFQKRQLVLASLVLALGTAVYLNWQFSDDHKLNTTGIIESTRELGEARYVNTSNVKENSESGQSQSTDAAKQYFAQAQTDRRQSRENIEEKIKSLAATPNMSEDVKNDLLKQVDEFAKVGQQESNVENLLKAKGFDECIVFIQNGECSVVVAPGKLNDNAALIIRDVVSGQTGIAFDKIKIMESK